MYVIAVAACSSHWEFCPKLFSNEAIDCIDSKQNTKQIYVIVFLQTPNKLSSDTIIPLRQLKVAILKWTIPLADFYLNSGQFLGIMADS